MSIVKSLRFPVTVQWGGQRLVETRAPGKEPLTIATPPEFRSGVAGVWSPEDLLVNAVASCFALTAVAVAERLATPLIGVRVEAAGHVERDRWGHHRFSVIELDAVLITSPDQLEAAERVATLAKDHCIVARALEVPVHVRVDVQAPAEEAAVA